MNLHARRVNAGLTVADAARRIGVDHRTLKKAEAGEPVQPPQAKRIAEFWGLEAIDLEKAA